MNSSLINIFRDQKSSFLECSIDTLSLISRIFIKELNFVKNFKNKVLRFSQRIVQTLDAECSLPSFPWTIPYSIYDYYKVASCYDIGKCAPLRVCCKRILRFNINTCSTTQHRHTHTMIASFSPDR